MLIKRQYDVKKCIFYKNMQKTPISLFLTSVFKELEEKE
jgi:hypothetical protein